MHTACSPSSGRCARSHTRAAGSLLRGGAEHPGRWRAAPATQADARGALRSASAAPPPQGLTPTARRRPGGRTHRIQGVFKHLLVAGHHVDAALAAGADLRAEGAGAGGPGARSEPQRGPALAPAGRQPAHHPAAAPGMRRGLLDPRRAPACRWCQSLRCRRRWRVPARSPWPPSPPGQHRSGWQSHPPPPAGTWQGGLRDATMTAGRRPAPPAGQPS